MTIYTIIPNRLYAGGKLDRGGWQFVAEHIHAVLNLRTEPDQPPIDVTGRLLLWAPILDKAAPDLHWVVDKTRLMNVLLDNGNTLYVHDTAGINRLGFILTAFYMQRFGYSRDTALAVLRRKKPELNPKPPYMALLSCFEKYLQMFAKLRYSI
ncbi:dual specificity protein phosphatase family protein [Cohnella pontilimi]|uniref:Dual specificity protein phosphatase family protein n=1 Tax=Cohnella pontilimi TaxID=2564100 RepID=A0A4U0FHZ4_9BACL|nr:dual specificity protein phosphatase family protein [Cohnella pontilimi]TJY44074.1 dual specificity protein phosphatase family protein [Cohnella pontilimi]